MVACFFVARAEASPKSIDELLGRAHVLRGMKLGGLARDLDSTIDDDPVHTKGKFGELLELALGATGGSDANHDFPHLAVELKTVPLGSRSRSPLESTYVCRIQVSEAETAEWKTAWARAKLSQVLFVPIEDADAPWQERIVGTPILFRPTAEQDAILRGDFDDAMGLIGAGRIEELTAHQGRWMQVRPKAAHGRVRTTIVGAAGELIETIPRGFYLRAKFVGALLLDPSAVPA